MNVSWGERPWNWIQGRQARTSGVIWLTGLSGAGKSTIAERVCHALRVRGSDVEHLDGDAIRAIFPNTGFSRADREAHVRRVAFLASCLERHGVVVVVALVSPYRESRAFARALCGHFIEVHVSTPLAECERRDVKGLYARARRGELRHLTGIDDPYEPPLSPDLVIDTTTTALDDATNGVLGAFRAHRRQPPPARRGWAFPFRSQLPGRQGAGT